MSGHTPGPWEVTRLGGEKGWHVCLELGRGTAPGFNCTADRFIKHVATVADYSDEALANARLIAAAPDLLAIVKHLPLELAHDTKSPLMELVNAVLIALGIAKAEGK